MNYGGGIGSAENFNLTCDLSSPERVIGCERFESIYAPGAAVSDLVDGSSISMTEYLDLFKVGEPMLAAGRNGGSRQRRQLGETEALAEISAGR
ncbi:hypothetical protein IEQ34_010572 [Dendrobium chrysotoxum]|uniref:Uncharacterized protein n=1 Tax=Dendrobium chrysotoxum TaxID=161865 RepID=A0AAV7GVU3_DENCH|nr:hypothetical protein IEQ34_010572 [Dendrobium chrysotoxum]